MDNGTLTARRRSRASLSSALVVATLVFAGCGGGDEASSDHSATAADTDEATQSPLGEAPKVVGLRLDEALDLLDGFDVTEVDSTGEGRSVWAPSNWIVIDQESAGMAVTLHLVNERDDPPGDNSEPAIPETTPAPTASETTSVPTSTLADSDSTLPERDWLDELHDSFGCGDTDWVSCFDADESDEGLELAMLVGSITRIEGDGSWLHVYMQETEPDALRWACIYTHNLFGTEVQVYQAGDVAAVRTRLDGTCS